MNSRRRLCLKMFHLVVEVEGRTVFDVDRPEVSKTLCHLMDEAFLFDTGNLVCHSTLDVSTVVVRSSRVIVYWLTNAR